MLARLKGLFSPDNTSPPILKEGLKPEEIPYISPEAASYLNNIFEGEYEHFLDVFGNLPSLYTQPEAKLKRLAQQPIVRRISHTNFSDLTGRVAVNYLVQDLFDPVERPPGSCADILGYLLAGLEQPELAESIQKNRLICVVDIGTCPEFFSAQRAKHIWVSLRESEGEGGVIIDPSLGSIFSRRELHGYNARESYLSSSLEIGEQESRVFPLQSWNGLSLDSIARCPKVSSQNSPNTCVLGLSSCRNWCFNLGVALSERKDTPFISVTHRNGQDQELYWLEDLDNQHSENISQIRAMASHNDELAVNNNTELADQVQNLVVLTTELEFSDSI